MNRTALFNEHLSMGARIVDFAGWEMPIQYEGIIEEHVHVRRAVGAFDVSHMGDVIIGGPEVGEFLDSLLTNPVSQSSVGKAVYGHLLNDDGKIIDDVITYHVLDGTYLMVPNASNVDTVVRWLKAHSDDQDIVDLSTRLSCIAVQGPKAEELVQRICSAPLHGMKRFTSMFASFEGEGTVEFIPELSVPLEGVGSYICRTGYTGEDGFEIIVENGDAPGLWRKLFEAGAGMLRPIGLGARDTLRLEMGYLLSGTDFDGRQSSLQTGPPWVVKWEHDFVGKGRMAEQRDVEHDLLVGIELLEKGVPRHGYDIVKDGRTIGRLTSGTMSPCMRIGIGLGYVPKDHSLPGTELAVRIRDKDIQARVVDIPFYKKR